MLKAIINSLADVDEALQSHYTEQDGKFVLAVEPIAGFALEDVAGLKSSLSKERSNVKALADSAKTFDGIDAQAARDAMRKIETMNDWTPEDKVREQIEAREKDLGNRHKAEVEKLQGEIGGHRAQLEKHLIEATAMAALQKAGGNVDLLLPHILQATKMERGENGNFRAQVVDTNGLPKVSMTPGSTDPMGIDEFVESLKQSESFAPAFAGSGATGSGTTGHSAGSARSQGTFVIGREEAKVPSAYRAAKAAAEKAGSPLTILDA